MADARAGKVREATCALGKWWWWSRIGWFPVGKCSKPTSGFMSYFASDGVDHIQLCGRHLARGRRAAELLGGEPVYEFTEWLNHVGPMGTVLKNRVKQRPVLFKHGETIEASGLGRTVPLFETQPIIHGTAVATDRRVAVVAEAAHQFAFSGAWDEVQSVRLIPSKRVAVPNTG